MYRVDVSPNWNGKVIKIVWLNDGKASQHELWGGWQAGHHSDLIPLLLLHLIKEHLAAKELAKGSLNSLSHCCFGSD